MMRVHRFTLVPKLAAREASLSFAVLERRTAPITSMQRSALSSVPEVAASSIATKEALLVAPPAVEESSTVKRIKASRALVRANKESKIAASIAPQETPAAASGGEEAKAATNAAADDDKATTTTSAKTSPAVPSLEECGLPPAMLSAFRANFPNVASLFPVQISALEAFRTGKDVVVGSSFIFTRLPHAS